MRIIVPGLALIAAIAVPVAAQAAGWSLASGATTTALVFGTPVTDRDAFRLECSGGTLVLSTWAGGPPRGMNDTVFPTRLSVFFGRTELAFAATGRVTGDANGAGRATRIDARIVDPLAFLNSLDGVPRLTTVIFAGRRMAPSPDRGQTGEFRKACNFRVATPAA